jgi:hypothetical protein
MLPSRGARILLFEAPRDDSGRLASGPSVAIRGVATAHMAPFDLTVVCSRDKFGRSLTAVTRNGESLADVLEDGGHGVRR